MSRDSQFAPNSFILRWNRGATRGIISCENGMGLARASLLSRVNSFISPARGRYTVPRSPCFLSTCSRRLDLSHVELTWVAPHARSKEKAPMKKLHIHMLDPNCENICCIFVLVGVFYWGYEYQSGRTDYRKSGYNFGKWVIKGGDWIGTYGLETKPGVKRWPTIISTLKRGQLVNDIIAFVSLCFCWTQTVSCVTAFI